MRISRKDEGGKAECIFIFCIKSIVNSSCFSEKISYNSIYCIRRKKGGRERGKIRPYLPYRLSAKLQYSILGSGRIFTLLIDSYAQSEAESFY